MSDADKVLLLRLYEKTSAKGNRYFAGRMGAASVVMMQDTRAESDGADPVWQVFVSEPRQAPAGASPAPRDSDHPIRFDKPSAARKSPPRAKSAVLAGQLNDNIGDIGR